MSVARLSTTAVAFVLTVMSHSAIAQSDLYIFGALGNADTDVSLRGLNRIDDGQGSYFLGAGYSATEAISIEAAYQDVSNLDAETDCPPGFNCLVIPVPTQADVRSISLSVVGSLPVADRFSVYGRLGISSWDIDFEGISTAFDTSGEDLLYGAGLRASLGDHWSLFADYQRIDFDMGTASIGASYRF